MWISSLLRPAYLPVFLLIATFFTTTTCLATAPATQEALNPSDFANPPLAARPGAFWPWLNGHVSLERITYELEQMKEKGMSGADIWDVRAQINPDNAVPVGPPFLGEESLNTIAHAVKEADRLGLQLGMIAASGWNAVSVAAVPWSRATRCALRSW